MPLGVPGVLVPSISIMRIASVSAGAAMLFACAPGCV
jgi:hypothetical protein